MPVFKYEVVDSKGKVLRGMMDAASEEDVRRQLISRGYAVNDVVLPLPPPSARPPQTKSAPRTRYRSTAPPGEMAVFFRGLESHLKAGIALHHALAEMGNQSPYRGMRFICERLSNRVQSGDSLADAMLEFPRAFPSHIVGIVSAGELGGFLPLVIGDVALDYELAQRSTSLFITLISRLLWANALFILLVVPIPRKLFAPGVESLKEGLLLGVMTSLNYIALPIIIFLLVYFVGRSLLRTQTLKPVAHHLLLSVPRVGAASRERSLAVFTKVLWRLQKAGILPIAAWEAACRSAENLAVASRLYAQTDSIRAGKRFSAAIADTGLFMSEIPRVLAAAETGGQTVESLDRIAAHYEDAAVVSTGLANWVRIWIGILVSVIALAAVIVSFIGMSVTYPDWVETFMGIEGL